MRNIRLYFSSIVFRGTKKGIAIAFVHILPWILIVSASFAFAKFGQSNLALESQGLLGFMFLIGSCVFTASKIRFILSGQEINFLKKLGFSGNELFAFCLSKVKIPFLIVTAGYACVYGLEAELSLSSGIKCLGMSALCFLWTAVISSIYVVLFNAARVTFLKDVAVFLALVAALSRSFRAVYVQGMGLFDAFEKMVRRLGRMRVMDFISSAFFSSFASMALSALAACIVFWVFFRKRFLRLSVYSVEKAGRRRQARFRVTVGSPFKSFLKRDLKVAYSSKIFVIIQAAAVALGAWASYAFGAWAPSGIGVQVAVYLAVVCWVISLKIQDVLVVDSMFANVYKTLPIKFKDFVFMKAALAALYSMPCPLALLAAEVAMGELTLLAAAQILAILALWAQLLFLYNTSIIMLYFPDVKNTTDLPLIIGDLLFVIPLFPVVMIICGLRAGAKKWRAW